MRAQNRGRRQGSLPARTEGVEGGRLPPRPRRPALQSRRSRRGTRWALRIQACPARVRHRCPTTCREEARRPGRDESVSAFDVPTIANRASPTASNTSTGLRNRSVSGYQKKAINPATTETATYRQSWMATGGTAPIRMSRVIPPKFAATNDNTRTPNISRRCLIPAAAPLSAKTKVPPRSRANQKCVDHDVFVHNHMIQRPARLIMNDHRRCLH